MKKKFTKKENQELKEAIVELRKQGVGDQEIYYRLRNQHTKKEIYNLVTRTPVEPLKKKYRILNNILIAFLAIDILSKLLLILPSLLSDKIIITASLFMVLPIILIPIYFIIGAIKYSAKTYKILGFLFAIASLNTSINFLKHINHTGKIDWIDFSIAILISSLGAIISLYIARKVFPNYRYIFKLKDKNGDYII